MEKRVQEETIRVSSYLQDIQYGIQRAEEEQHKSTKYQESYQSQDVSEAKRLWQEVDQSEYQNYHAISELLRLRYSIMIAQREEVEELERLQSDKISFLQREERLKAEVGSPCLIYIAIV